jgi:hypothetical protein
MNYKLTCGTSIRGKSIIRTDEKIDADLDFLLKLPESDLETLVVCRRDRSDSLGKQTL